MKLCEIKAIRDKLVCLKADLIWQENQQKEYIQRKKKNDEYLERLDNMMDEEDIF